MKLTTHSARLSIVSALLMTAGLSTFTTASAGTLTITSGPTFSTTLTNNTITSSIIGNNLLKISGNATFTQPETPLQSVTISVQGAVSAVTGDSFNLAYNFSSFLSGSTAMTYSLQADAVVNTFGGPFSLNNVVSESGSFDPGTNLESGTKTAAVNPTAFQLGGNPLNGTYTLRFVLNTSTLAAGQSVSLTIPNNSIDLQVAPAPVPEPSTYAMLGFGAAGLVMVLRKRKIA